MTEETAELDQLWTRFHSSVNMSGHELRTWLLTEASGEVAFEGVPDLNLSPLGERVVRLLNKRRGDVEGADIEVMRRVVEIVRTELAAPRPEDPAWRHRLMTIGHDPLQPGSGRPDEEEPEEPPGTAPG